MPPPDAQRGRVEAGYLSAHLVLCLVAYLAFEARRKREGARDPGVWAMALWSHSCAG